MTEYDVIRLRSFSTKSSMIGELVGDVSKKSFKVITSKIFLIVGCVFIGLLWFVIGLSKKK